FLKRGDIPTKMDLFQDPEIKERIDYSETIMKSIDLSKPRTIHPLYPRISNIVQVYLSGVIAGRMTPEEASKKMIKELRKIISL
ncbi:MAG: ABC transporter substrate-binding protein, partial [Candidatus Calescibacterium sp.]|nr:ABC transporter substrate-binding protein [Candidatus Calescibacterium sp.]MDW8132982.1 ABC transporter substrate-binding protein [Candidatus Calescibacterium sp.]